MSDRLCRTLVVVVVGGGVAEKASGDTQQPGIGCNF